MRKNFDALRAKKERLRNVKTRGKKGKGRLSPGGRTDNAKAEAEAAVDGGTADAKRGAAELRNVVPRTAVNDSIG